MKDRLGGPSSGDRFMRRPERSAFSVVFAMFVKGDRNSRGGKPKT